MATQQGVKIPISLDTNGGEKEMGRFKRFIQREAGGITRSLALGKALGVVGLTAASAAGNTFLQGLADPTRAYSGQIQNAQSGTAEAAFTAGGATIGGIPGAVIGNIAGKIAGAVLDHVNAQSKFVEGNSGAQVGNIVSQFAIAGVPVSDADMTKVLNQFRDQNKRVYDTLTQLARVQDQTAAGYNGDISRGLRNATTYVSRRGLGQ